MAEFRQNYITKEWVIVAPERSARPRSYRESRASRPQPSAHDPACPFCPGREADTGEEVLRYGPPGGWDVRVVRNLYSALDPGRSTARRAHGRFLAADSFGYAEVVIETPRHDVPLHAQSDDGRFDVLRAYRERCIAVASDPRVAIVTLFRNAGPSAGTSLEHPHSQIVASPIVPPHIRDPIQKAALHFDTSGRCAYCESVEEELAVGDRVIRDDGVFLAVCPYASRSPFEIRIYPHRHVASFTWSTDDELRAFASTLGDVLRRVDVALGAPDYNFIIRSAPVGDEDVRYLHWYFVLIPRIAVPAGFEIGTGIYINVEAPEGCAERLRGVA